MRVGEAIAPRRRRLRRRAGLLTVGTASSASPRWCRCTPAPSTRAARLSAPRRDRLLPAPGHAGAVRVHAPAPGCATPTSARRSHGCVAPGRAGTAARRRAGPASTICDIASRSRTLLDWYRDGGDVAARLPLLSTYLGHVDPARHLLVPARRARAARPGRAAPRRDHLRRRPAHDRARPDPAGVLHRPADPPAPRQPPHHRRLPRHAPAAARLRRQQHRQATLRARLRRPRRAADRARSSTTSKPTAATAPAPATPGWPRSTRCSATPRCATPNTPPTSSGSWPSHPNGSTTPLITYLTEPEIDALLAAPRPRHLDRPPRPRPARCSPPRPGCASPN